MAPVTHKTRIRDLPPSAYFKLRAYFDQDDKWKTLASSIPDRKGEEKYSIDDIKNFELEFAKGKSPTEAVLRDWSFNNPNVLDFLRVLAQIQRIDVLQLFLVDLMKVITDDDFDDLDDLEEYLNEKWPKKKAMARSKVVDNPVSLHPVESCSGSETLESSNVFQGQFASGCKSVNLQDGCSSDAVTAQYPSRKTDRKNYIKESKTAVEYYKYSRLGDMTDNWNMDSLPSGGRHLGSGGYATVFLGRTLCGQHLAVKRLKLKEECIQQFFEEVNTLIRFIHPNIVPLLGVSQDGPQWCIIYEYMENGTLEERLECKGTTPPLTGSQRCRIAKGIAQGLHYLHTNDTIAIVHRDIKSANILLDYDFSAKIGDCGLAHFGASDPCKSHTVTQLLVGTKAYVPPEYMYGEVSEKFDAYSFGVVLYEMITGLPSYDENRSSHSLSYYLRESYQGDPQDQTVLEKFVDEKLAGKCSMQTVEKVFVMAHRLTTPEKYNRPTVAEVLDDIMNWPQQW